MEIINTCSTIAASLGNIRTIAYYAHLVPVAILVFIGLFVLLKSHFGEKAKIFSLFILFFSVWLVSDLIIWVSNNYYAIMFFWSYLDYIAILLFLCGVYFFTRLTTGRQVSHWFTILLFSLTLPAFYLTIMGQGIGDFVHSVCEAEGNDILNNYKLFIQLFSFAAILVVGINELYKGRIKRRQIVFFGGPLLLFLTVFGLTEYFSSATGIYEINLYSLFVLPIFLIATIFAITNLHIFNVRLITTQLLAYILVILLGSQFLFLKDSTAITLSLVTFALSVILGFVLLKNVLVQAKQRQQIEALAKDLSVANTKLKDLDKLKTEFLSLASHQLRSPLTAIKGYASMLLEGSFGTMDSQPKEAVNRIFISSQNLVKVVEDLLNVSKIEQGGMKYEMQATDLGKMLVELTNELKVSANNKGLELSLVTDGHDTYGTKGDALKLRQVFLNLVDNSIKYTKKGFVKVSIVLTPENTIKIGISDSGMGMTEETKNKLFQKFSRGEGGKVNAGGSGLGLYLAKEIIEAHQGRIWVESPGLEQGSTFYVELSHV